MSKVFIVRFHVIQFTRYSVAFRSRGELVHISTSNFICQALFSSFLNFFEEACRLIFDLLVARRQLCYVITSTFICQELFSSFSKFLFDVLLFDCLADSLHMLPSNSSFVNRLFRTKREPLSRLSVVILFNLIRHHQSGRNRLHFYGTPQQSFRRYPHPGMRRNCGPAGSSAVPLLLWSWA